MRELRLNAFLTACAVSLLFARAFAVTTTTQAPGPRPPKLDNCRGYVAENVDWNDYGVSADLKLIGAGCAAYGKDIALLRLDVNYDTSESSDSAHPAPMSFKSADTP